MFKKTVPIILCILMFSSYAVAFGDGIRYSNGLLISAGMSEGDLIKRFGPPDNRMSPQDIYGDVREEWIYADGTDIVTLIIRCGKVVDVLKN